MQENMQENNNIVEEEVTSLPFEREERQTIIDTLSTEKETKKKKKRKFKPLENPERYSPDVSVGLSKAQVDERLNHDLSNYTPSKYSKSYFSIFFQNIFTFFNLACFLVAIALISVGSYSDLLFMVIITLNITIGIFQEIRAKKTIEKLNLLTSPTAHVIRDGQEHKLEITDIVLDDVILLSAGKQVPTDCVLLEGNIEVNESLLTGESLPIKKEIGDMLYAGSFISSGNCKVRAEKVGKDNYIQILTAKAKKYKKPKSEILSTLRIFISCIIVVATPIAVFMALNNYSTTNHDIYLTVTRTATVIVGMIPAGMFLLTSVALFSGVISLSKKHTSVKDLYSLEMLARVDVLCLDKTGTITDGCMKVADCMILNKNIDYSINDIISSMVYELKDNNQTSIALGNHFGHAPVYKACAMMPFSSARKCSAVSFPKLGTFVLGAPEFVMPDLNEKIEKLIKKYTTLGLRVLLLANSSSMIRNGNLPTTLKPIGIVTIADNIREDAPDTIRWFQENNVNIKVISGDNPLTVAEIARRVGIEGAENYISLDGLSDEEVAAAADKYTVFCRVTPEQKLIIVKSLKASGHTVAMTGDGVNDILALKEADCSIAMASGSEATRNVAHLILMNSTFASMPAVVREGRRVINNVQKSSALFLTKTLFTIIFALIALGTNTLYPFTTTQMLLLEVFVIGLPSFFLSLQPNSDQVKGKFISHIMSRALPGAIIMAISIVGLMFIQNNLLEINSFVDITDKQFETMCLIAITYSGMIVLFRLCQPFNFYRGLMFVVMLSLCSAALALGFEVFFKLEGLALQNTLFLIIILEFNLLFSSVLNGWFDKLHKLTLKPMKNKNVIKNK